MSGISVFRPRGLLSALLLAATAATVSAQPGCLVPPNECIGPWSDSGLPDLITAPSTAMVRFRGDLYVATSEVEGHKVGGIVRAFKNKWVEVGGGLALLTNATPRVDDMQIWDPDGAGPQPELLVVAGRFDLAGGGAAHNIAIWDGSVWSPFPVGLNGNGKHLLTTWDPDGPGVVPPQLIATVAIAGAAEGVVRYSSPTSPPVALGSFDADHGTLEEILMLEAIDPDGAGPQPTRLFIGGTIGGPLPLPNRPLKFLNDAAVWNNAGSFPGNGGAIEVRGLAAADLDGAGEGSTRLFAIGNNLHPFLAGSQSIAAATFAGFSTSWTVVPAAPGDFSPNSVVRVPDPASPGVGPDTLVYAGDSNSNPLYRVAGFAGNFAPMNLIASANIADARLLAGAPAMSADIAIGGDFFAGGLPPFRDAAVVRISPGPAFSLLPPPLPTLGGLWTLEEVTSLGRSTAPEFPHALLIAQTGPTFGGVNTTNLAAWNGRSIESADCTLNGGARINAIASLDLDGAGPLGEEIVIGGDFQTINAAPAEALAIRRAGTWISPFGDFTPANGTGPFVTAIVDTTGSPFDGFHLFAGNFATTDGVLANNVGLWSQSTGWVADSNFNQGANGPVRTAMIFDGEGFLEPTLVFGGTFTQVGDNVDSGPLGTFSFTFGWQGVGVFSPSAVVNKVLAWDHDANSGSPDQLIVAGDFSIPEKFVLRDVARYNGSNLVQAGATFATGMAPLAEVFDAAVFDPDGPGAESAWLVIVGFTDSGCSGPIATPALFGLRPNGNAWIPLKDAFNRAVCEGARTLFVHDDDGFGPAGPALFLGGSGFNIEDGSALGIAKLPSLQPGLWVDCSVNEIDDPTAYACMIPADSSTPFVHDRTLLGRTQDSTYEVKAFFDHDVHSLHVRSDFVEISVGNNLAQRGKATMLTAGAGPGSTAVEIGGEGLKSILRVQEPAADGVFRMNGDVLVGTNPINNEFNVQRLELSFGIDADISDRLDIGSAGGQFVVNSAASLITHGGTRIGHDHQSVGTMIVSNASWFAADSPPVLEVAGEGRGTLLINGGATAEFTSQSLIIAASPGSVGDVQVDGPATSFDWLGGPITIGAAGLGIMNLTGGAQATSSGAAAINVAGNPGSSGILQLFSNNEGTLWNASGAPLNIGTAGGFGQFYIQKTATVITNRIEIGANGFLLGDGSVSVVDRIRNAGTVSPVGLVSEVPLVLGPSDMDLFGLYEQVSAQDNAGIPGRLVIDIAGPNPADVDRLDIVGAAELGGHLDVRFAPGYMPAPDELAAGVSILQATTITGAFDVANFPGLPPTLSGAPRFLRFETRSIARGAFEVAVIEDALAIAPPAASESQDFDAGGAGADAALGDLDGDGDADIAITIPDAADPAGAPGSVVILFNAGTIDGFWQGFSSTVQITVEPNPASILIADFDGVSGNDIAYSTLSDNTVHTLLNDGTGNFAALRGAIPPETVTGDPGHLIKSDFNQAGGVDVAVVTADPDTVTILFNSRDTGGKFTGFPIRETIPTPPTETAGVAADIDNDKWDDIVVPDEDDESATLIGNDGPELTRGGLVFDPVTISIPVPGNPVDVDSADLDLDGFKDLAFATANGDSVSVLLGVGARAFLPALTVPAGDAPSRLVLADLDNDMDKDLAVVTSNEKKQRIVRVIRNDLFGGQLGFAPQADLEPGATPDLILAADVTGDGQDDLVTVNDAGGVLALRGAATANDISVFAFAACNGDANNDRVVDMKDITATLTNWLTDYSPGTGPGDCNSDGFVGFNDITCTLSSFGRDCR